MEGENEGRKAREKEDSMMELHEFFHAERLLEHL